MAKEKKRKREKEDLSSISKPKTSTNHQANTNHEVDTSKPTALFQPVAGGRKYTVTIALPGSVIANAKSHDQKNYLAGSIARALAVFCVDEVVIFNDDDQASTAAKDGSRTDDYTAFSNPDHFLAHILSYLETPPHLRKSLFPMHPNLRTAGTLPSLDMPHHLRANEWCPYREGVTTAQVSDEPGTFVDIGLPAHRLVKDAQIPPQTRVTVQLDADQRSTSAQAVSPSTPKKEAGYFWGYAVRRCPSLSTVFTECPFDGGYDLSFGTSERGTELAQTLKENAIPPFQHLLIVFGGVAGLETAAKNDRELSSKGINGGNVGELFDYWVNVLPGQGSRTIRTEEAVWLGLMGLHGLVQGNRGK